MPGPKLAALVAATEEALTDGVGVSAASLAAALGYRGAYIRVCAWYRVIGFKGGRAGECAGRIQRAAQKAAYEARRREAVASGPRRWLSSVPPRLLAQLRQEPRERQVEIMARWRAEQMAEEEA